MRYFDIYSIDKKITNVDGSHRLEKRTETPLSLMEATKIASEYSKRGHVVEFRKVSQETQRNSTMTPLDRIQRE